MSFGPIFRRDDIQKLTWKQWALQKQLSVTPHSGHSASKCLGGTTAWFTSGAGATFGTAYPREFTLREFSTEVSREGGMKAKPSMATNRTGMARLMILGWTNLEIFLTDGLNFHLMKYVKIKLGECQFMFLTRWCCVSELIFSQNPILGGISLGDDQKMAISSTKKGSCHLCKTHLTVMPFFLQHFFHTLYTYVYVLYI